MIKTFEHLPEAALTQPINDFEPVADVLPLLGDVLILIIIEAVVVHAVGRRRRTLRCLAFVDVEPVYSIIVQYLLLLDFHQVL